ncbi:MAG TPA: hypothetical protein VK133_01485 [Amoebophilaceae bacterium]|jgi:hypothetical protein|nr:hypothetical protein [Amoebophilaceae bacterium]
MNRYEEVEQLVLSLKEEFHKFYEKDNKAAGTRVRKGMQELKKIAQEIRASVLDVKANREPVKA